MTLTSNLTNQYDNYPANDNYQGNLDYRHILVTKVFKESKCNSVPPPIVHGLEPTDTETKPSIVSDYSKFTENLIGTSDEHKGTYKQKPGKHVSKSNHDAAKQNESSDSLGEKPNTETTGSVKLTHLEQAIKIKETEKKMKTFENENFAKGQDLFYEKDLVTASNTTIPDVNAFPVAPPKSVKFRGVGFGSVSEKSEVNQKKSQIIQKNDKKLKGKLETGESSQKLRMYCLKGYLRNRCPILAKKRASAVSKDKSDSVSETKEIDGKVGARKPVVNNFWVVDSGASRHMTGNISLLSDVKPINGGNVTFAGNKGGRITGEGKMGNEKVTVDKIPDDWIMMRAPIFHDFAPYTPQQNGVAERKNRTLIETARTMLSDAHLPIKFWSEAVHTACHVLNRVLIVKRFNKTSYQLRVYPMKRVYFPSSKTIESHFNVDYRRHTFLTPKSVDIPAFEYKTSFDSFSAAHNDSADEHSKELLAAAMLHSILSPGSWIPKLPSVSNAALSSQNVSNLETMSSSDDDESELHDYSKFATPSKKKNSKSKKKEKPSGDAPKFISKSVFLENEKVFDKVASSSSSGTEEEKALVEKNKLKDIKAKFKIVKLRREKLLVLQVLQRPQDSYYSGRSSSSSSPSPRYDSSDGFFDTFDSEHSSDFSNSKYFSNILREQLCCACRQPGHLAVDCPTTAYIHNTAKYVDNKGRIFDEPWSPEIRSTRKSSWSKPSTPVEFDSGFYVEREHHNFKSSETIYRSRIFNEAKSTPVDEPISLPSTSSSVPVSLSIGDLSSSEEADANLNNLADNIEVPDSTTLRIHNIHPQENIIEDSNSGVRTRHQLSDFVDALIVEIRDSGVQNEIFHSCFLSQVEPTNVDQALEDASWVEAMQEEL
ncbi:hypothetical protein SSX86_006398 [Deinandra increscens subsp. villosa]|uniref:CCHC-type domain-containing protein n=1 Tax=Deinandra increscens subsp. villosa TaxID=3103831 RepID=A0AAP0DF72_9ASTR